ncbi:MAG: hypothetical protein QF450_10585 [Rhodospirillales bacterium]|nr:hypothetical protein [Rhodospirillales bacterium]
MTKIKALPEARREHGLGSGEAAAAWCIDACPFGVVICDLCEKRAEGPACVEVYPKDALEISTPEVIAQKAPARGAAPDSGGAGRVRRQE